VVTMDVEIAAHACISHLLLKLCNILHDRSFCGRIAMMDVPLDAGKRKSPQNWGHKEWYS